MMPVDFSVKFSGCVIVIAASTLMGMQKGESVKNQHRQMRYLQRIICMVESEIRYAHSYLGEIFLNTARHLEEPYKEWLLSMREEMEGADGRSFGDIWERGVLRHLKGSGLPGKELERLARLGGQLGASDLKLQLKVLELYQEQLGREILEARDEMRVKIRLCRCLGVMAGVLVAVLLI